MKKEKNATNQEQGNATVKVRKFPRFGVLDAVIIILVIAVVVGLAFRYNLFKSLLKFQDLEEYTVEFSTNYIKDSTPNYVKENDIVYFKESGTHFGKMTTDTDISNQILNSSHAEYVFIEKGEKITVLYPDYDDNHDPVMSAKGRIICKGKMSSDGTFLLNGSDYIAPGETHVICTENVTLQINILSINPVE